MTSFIRLLLCCALLLPGAAGLGAASGPLAILTGRISSFGAPPGGTVQVTLILSSPLPIAEGNLDIDFDPAVFDSISAINVFSASGDQAGIANIQGRHADVQFTSNSGGIGRLPDYPVLEVTVPVLSIARTGTIGAVAMRSASPWRDVSGYRYAVSFQSPGISIGNGISIQSVTPGGGVVPAGTQVQINGQGFTAATRLQLDGVVWSNQQFVNSRQLNFTLSAPADLTGRLLVVSDTNGAQARFYSFFIPTSVHRSASIPPGIQPIFPQVTYAGGNFGGCALENQTLTPVDVVFTQIISSDEIKVPPTVSTKTMTIPSGEVYLGEVPGGLGAPALPIRALCLKSALNDVGFEATIPPAANPAGLTVYANPLTWNLRPTDPLPAPILFPVFTTPFSPVPSPVPDVVTSTDDTSAWLSATIVPDGPPGSYRVSVSVDHTGMTPGPHLGFVTITLPGVPAPVAQIHARLNINPEAMIVGPNWVGASFFPSSFAITSDSGAVPITVSASDSWLSVTPTTATTPAMLTVSVSDPSIRPDWTGFKSGTITIQGPGNTLTIPVEVDLKNGLVYPLELTFSAKVGSAEAITRELNVGVTIQPITFDIATDSGGPWLSAAIAGSGLAVSANPSGLDAGTYQGTITIRTTNLYIRQDPIAVTVTLIVWTSPSALEASPATIDVTEPSGGGRVVLLTFSSGSMALPFSFAAQTDDGSGWLSVQGLQDFEGPHFTPSGINVFLGDYNLPPGVYYGRVIITAPPGSSNIAVVPVTFTVTPATPTALTGTPPLISSLVNAASLSSGPIAPGEIVSVFGIFGPDATSGLNIGPDGKANTSSYGNRVLFNGSPAPLTYISPTQISVVVPYEITGSSNATVELDMSGIHSPAWGVPVSASAPGLFTQAGTGQGPANILNEDNSPNAASNPATRGSIVQIFATGEGQTVPPGITGAITQSDTKSPVLPVTVQIGGLDAKLVSATEAPNAIAGLLQIKAQIPAGLQPGTIPVTVRIGSASSQTNATLYVK
jgi:uncharacterized protein (TIGR03437 family)